MRIISTQEIKVMLFCYLGLLLFGQAKSKLRIMIILLPMETSSDWRQQHRPAVQATVKMNNWRCRVSRRFLKQKDIYIYQTLLLLFILVVHKLIIILTCAWVEPTSICLLGLLSLPWSMLDQVSHLCRLSRLMTYTTCSSSLTIWSY